MNGHATILEDVNAVRRFQKAHEAVTHSPSIVETTDENCRMVMALSLLRERALKRGDSEEVNVIEAALSNDADALLRVRIGNTALTPRQWDVLKAIDSFWNANGYAPTFTELARQLEVSKETIHEHVHALERKRVLKCDKFKSRSVRILDRF